MDTSLIGWESQPKAISVEKGQLKFFAKATGADCVAVDNSVSPEWAAEHV